MRFSIKEYISEIYRSAVLENQIRASLPPAKKQNLFKRFNNVRANVECPNTRSHVYSFVKEILTLPKEVKGCVVEAGCFKGGSTAQFSICAKMVELPLYVFDSFQGLPRNDEPHEKSILGHSIKGWFEEGKFCGTLNEVQQNIAQYG